MLNTPDSSRVTTIDEVRAVYDAQVAGAPR